MNKGKSITLEDIVVEEKIHAITKKKLAMHFLLYFRTIVKQKLKRKVENSILAEEIHQKKLGTVYWMD